MSSLCGKSSDRLAAGLALEGAGGSWLDSRTPSEAAQALCQQLGSLLI